MPSQKFARAPLWCALSLALGLAFSSAEADAAGLGRLTIQSGLGQPLRAELEVTSVGRDELPTLQVRLAPLAAFRAANLEFNPALTNLRFVLERRPDGTHFVRINSPQVVNEPFLDLMVELTWSTGRVIREYTVLLDPPSLRAQPEIVAPIAPPTAAAPAQTPARPAPATAPTPPLAAAPASPPASGTGPASYLVKPGDTLGRIAAQNKPGSVSLDQMLVAMFRSNPQAFSGNNMNRLKAGATVTIPSEAEAAAVAAPAARREVVAQSSDFAQYKSRLARVAEGAPVAAAPSAAAGGGQVTTRVEDQSAAAGPTGDQLKIARVDDKGGATAAATRADEATAKARAITEEQERADQLKKTNEAIKKALEIQSKAGAQVQQQTDQKGAPAPAPIAAAPAQPTAAEPAKTVPAEPATSPPPTAAAPAPAPAAVPAPAPAQQEPSVVSDLLGNTTTQLGLAGIAALLAGLFGWSWYRKRKLEGADRFSETEGLQANSLFGATGGQSVDTGTSTFNSSFIPAASQLDSNEVDPVAEADVYIAYGREEQAEDILKEALRLQPDRHAVRVKLLEIYARRGDKTMFMTIAEDLRSRTGGEGEDWERAVKLGRTLDPGHAMFAGGPSTELGRAATTAFRFDATTRSGSPSTIGGGATTGLDLSGLTANSATVKNEAPSAPPLTRMVVDTRMSDTTTMSADTKMPTESRLTGPESVSAPTTQFHATLPAGQPANTISAPAAPVTDFGSLDFDLGPTKINFGPTTKMPETESGATHDDDEDDFLAAASAPKAPPPASPDTTGGLGNKYPAMLPTATGIGIIPDLDLNIPSTRMPVPEPEPEPVVSAAYTRAAEPVEALYRPTVVGAMKTPGVNTMVGAGWRDDAAARLTANTDQATVPLIDFDLSAVAQDSTRRGETEPGSALAQQMATKLDLARGYIDLGVKDGARELVDEVVRDGTKEQRQAAVELIKQLES